MRIFLLFASILAAFAQTRPLQPSLMEDAGKENLPSQKLGVDDLVAVSVYDAPELTRTLRVEEDGTIHLPLLKDGVQASGLLPPTIALSNMLGAQWMLALRLDKELNYIILGAGLVNLAGALTLGRWYQPIGMAWSLVIAEAFVVVGAFVFLRWRKLDPWSGSPTEAAL